MTNAKAMVPSFGRMVVNISASGRLVSNMESAHTSARRELRSKVNGKMDVKSSGLVSLIVPVRPPTKDKTIKLINTEKMKRIGDRHRFLRNCTII